MLRIRFDKGPFSTSKSVSSPNHYLPFKQNTMFPFLQNTLKDFFKFIRKPVDQQHITQSASQKAKTLFTLLVIDIPITFLLLALLNGFHKLGWIQIENNKISVLSEQLSIGMVALTGILLIPFIEELIFRLFLRFKRNYLLQLTLLILPGSEKTNRIPTLWFKKFHYIFYFSALAFGLIHIANYDADSAPVYLLPVLILPQFITGLFIGYLRVRYNFISGYLMHALHNAVVLLIAFFAISAPTEILHVTTHQYSLKIEEVTRPESTSFTYAADSVDFVGTDFKNILSVLLKKEENLIDHNNNALFNKKITLSFKKKSAYHLNKDSIILAHLSKVYAFKLEPKRKNQKIYSLYVKDTLQLLKHCAQSNHNSSNIILSPEHINAANVTLDQMAKELSSAYKIRFESDSTLHQKLTINVPNGDFSKLANTLRIDYGIELKETEKETDLIYVNFQQ